MTAEATCVDWTYFLFFLRLDDVVASAAASASSSQTTFTAPARRAGIGIMLLKACAENGGYVGFLFL